ncbi:hypothetical protein CEXT_520301 [Caerostris extrusa]|uniref:Uncharacterized protein n=1 Tax=Caerostris extrusa TaxID=172846 RepID=A0AAV4XHL3_CAEEX|nr:hypothetical protein CEXT_520301 [Caerostris extrusa]
MEASLQCKNTEQWKTGKKKQTKTWQAKTLLMTQQPLSGTGFPFSDSSRDPRTRASLPDRLFFHVTDLVDRDSRKFHPSSSKHKLCKKSSGTEREIANHPRKSSRQPSEPSLLRTRKKGESWLALNVPLAHGFGKATTSEKVQPNREKKKKKKEKRAFEQNARN